jgi:predicted TPR repeat methyltransferase
LAVRDGYREWAPTYERVVQDEMDLRLLERLTAVEWVGGRRAIDLACGTGRTGAWLRARGVRLLDGIDLTPEMLAQARARRLYDQLLLGDLRATGLPAAAYDLATAVLADEHLAEILRLSREAGRLLAPSGRFVIVGYHPFFLMLGSRPTSIAPMARRRRSRAMCICSAITRELPSPAGSRCSR